MEIHESFSGIKKLDFISFSFDCKEKLFTKLRKSKIIRHVIKTLYWIKEDGEEQGV